ncbi:nucleotide-diphospho-sugar transferase [Massarina eburnea CBS 473.64]|uniref:Nucleotide-diphospho-sugar transferase n=1 Tax=Massarina eburnea CBS 473.64 TaxID=1395130 RepID=A0A6A6RU49_9PLEO|nr:nucleotide-diphospho-sugar transferase [Massarina eburnea CBS 473.64]
MHTHHIDYEPGKDGHGINAYATLLTRPSYLAGAILLAHTLHKHAPSTPLIILYTPETLPEPTVKALEAEVGHSNAIAYPVDHLRLPKEAENDGVGKGGMVAERFTDTWTKLRVFEVLEAQGKKVERLCFLDADMMVFSDPSPLIFSEENDRYLAADEGKGRRICATHVCVCNLDGDAWAPETWKKENCAFAALKSPSDIAPARAQSESSTHGIFNSGTFLFHPSPEIRDFVMGAFRNTPAKELGKLKFPDQDFLNQIFDTRWSSLSWRTNALKTWRYWHPNIWHDDQVAVLHYIVDKPWATRCTSGEQGKKIAGYKGDDGETHSWWWDNFGKWEKEREAQKETELIDTVRKYVAGDKGEQCEELRPIGSGAQEFAKKWKGKNDGEGTADKQTEERRGGHEDLGQGPHGPILRKPMLGERGHGRVVRGGRGRGGSNINPNGSSYMEP